MFNLLGFSLGSWVGDVEELTDDGVFFVDFLAAGFCE
jgi:hypothetical protein